MKKAMAWVVMAMVMMGLTVGDALARAGRSGGGFSSSRSSSRSYSSSRKSGGYGSSRKSTPKAAPKPKSPAQIKAQKAKYAAQAKKNKMANERKAKVAAQKKQEKAKVAAAKAKTTADAKSFKKMDTKSPQYTKTDKMLQKNIGKSGKTYKSRDAAKSDMTKKMASKKYDYKDSKSAMASRPSYVPQNHRVGGVTYNTTYVGGHYGYYGSGGMFMPYLATQMVVNDMMLRSYGYNPTPYHHPMSPMSPAGSTVMVILILAIIIGGGCYMSRF